MFNFIKYILESLLGSKEEQSASPVSSIKPRQVLNSTVSLPWHETRKWGKRPLSRINKIVVHQSLTTGSLEGINNYHITPGNQNHISPKGAPHICYHYAIDRDGEIHHCNPLSSLVWHCKGQNTSGVGVVILGDFDGPTYQGKDKDPTDAQMEALEYLLDNHLVTKFPEADLTGHADFGKENCPGNTIYSYIQEKKNNA